jgi:hypothetical protein
MKWSKEEANSWYKEQPWLVGCNFLPSSAINQLEMFQEDTFDEETIEKELDWAKDLGFNSLRVYLHDLLWSEKDKFKKAFDKFLDICEKRNIKPIIVLFDDCHRPFPKLGKQPLPVKGVHNSGWKQSPGMELVNQVDEEKIDAKEFNRLKEFVQGVLKDFSSDERILMWDIYNEPGQFGIGDKALKLLQYTWEWAYEIRPFILMKQKNWNRPLRDLKNLKDLCYVPSIWQESLELLLNSPFPFLKKKMSVVTTGVLLQVKAKLTLTGQQF